MTPDNRPGRLLSCDPLPPLPGAEASVFLHFLDDYARPCAIYVALARPHGQGPHPVVIHCPGGTQTVDEADLRWWAERGFACAALDWQHAWLPHHPPGRKSCWPGGVVEQAQPAQTAAQAILPIAIRAVGVLIDWLATLPDLAVERLGLTGISWGGYLAWVAAAYEPRVRALVPIYGCGGIFAPGHPYRPPVPASLARRWQREWDPASLAHRQHAPVCFISGTNDRFGWLSAGARLLADLNVPWRCLWSPNLDHSLDRGAGLLAEAWMRHHLAAGSALPPTPAWDADGRLSLAGPPPIAVEPWWTPSPGPDDRRCWWPGEAPPDAPVRARLILVRWADGSCQSTPPLLLPATRSTRTTGELGDDWLDARAGLGWR